MTDISSFDTGAFDGIDMSELDLLDIEIVQTARTTGIPETGASCCPSAPSHCSSCCIDIT
ncbi:MAG TPA: hypothetical protein VMS43_01165 [Allosphingosinicella sp.]|nr:hypothetical protein [Allosphingosinicella sp.]